MTYAIIPSSKWLILYVLVCYGVALFKYTDYIPNISDISGL
jgi:hypothetical protein